MELRAKHRLEYWLLRSASALLNVLPLRAAFALAWITGWIMHRVFGFRADEARHRIRLVLGEGPSERELRRIAWLSWRNLCFDVVEMARFPKIAKGDIEDFMPGIGAVLSDVDRLRGGEGKGLVLATMHMGNWEMGGLAMKMIGLPLFVVARRQKNPLTDDYLLGVRQKAGMDVVMNDQRVMKNIIRKLKQGNILAILPDVRSRTPGLDVSYLGDRANIGGGTAMFARQTGVPILPAYGVRVGWTKHKWTLLDPVYPDQSLEKREDWRRMTQLVLDEFSEVVKRHPEQYFWYNKRWVLDPLEK